MAKLLRVRQNRVLYKKQTPKQIRKLSTPEYYARLTNGDLMLMLGAAAALIAVANYGLHLLATGNVL